MTKIYDAGKTQLEPSTFTALDIGPVPECKIDPLIKDQLTTPFCDIDTIFSFYEEDKQDQIAIQQPHICQTIY